MTAIIRISKAAVWSGGGARYFFREREKVPGVVQGLERGRWCMVHGLIMGPASSLAASCRVVFRDGLPRLDSTLAGKRRASTSISSSTSPGASTSCSTSPRSALRPAKCLLPPRQVRACHHSQPTSHPATAAAAAAMQTKPKQNVDHTHTLAVWARAVSHTQRSRASVRGAGVCLRRAWRRAWRAAEAHGSLRRGLQRDPALGVRHEDTPLEILPSSPRETALVPRLCAAGYLSRVIPKTGIRVSGRSQFLLR